MKHGAPFDKGDALPVLPLPAPPPTMCHEGPDAWMDTIVTRRIVRSMESARKVADVRTDDATSRRHASETMIYLQPADTPQRYRLCI